MERKGIISAGNWLVDSVKFIDVLPAKGNLTTITDVELGLGGCSHNVLVDLAKLKAGIPLYAGGCIGNDAYGKMVMDAIHENGIDDSNMDIIPGASTSYTDVMSETGGDKTRTFFHCRGANALLDIDHIRAMKSDAKIFHLGYLLLLDSLDKADPEYGVVAARALKELQEKGYKTSVDVVSEEGDRFRSIVRPCLKYIDYLIINEVEAGACTGITMRDSEGNIILENIFSAAEDLLKAGVGKYVVIHFPEGGLAVSSHGNRCFVPSDRVPKEEVVSSVGAGDAFCAGSLYAIHEGYDLDRLLCFANACARFNLYGATSTNAAPTLDKVLDYINK